MPSPRRASHDRFAGIVAHWNKANPEIRQALRQKCRNRGHRYIEPPFSTPERVTYVCQDCLQYLEPTPFLREIPRRKPQPSPVAPWVHPHWFDVDGSIARWKAAGCPVEPEAQDLAA